MTAPFIPIPQRVASLLPAATEIVCALGLGDRLVLRSHECDHPGWVSRLPHATAPGYDPEGTSYGIDERIRALLQEGLSVFRVDADVLRAAAPEVIVTQDRCEVCAVPLDDIRNAVRAYCGADTRIVSLSASNLEGVFADVIRVAEALHVPEKGRVVAGEIRAGIRRAVRGIDEAARRPLPRVLAIEWLDPLMVAGNWVPELIHLSGGEPLLGRAGEHSEFVEWDDIRGLDPDLILVVPCGFGISRIRAEMSLLTGRPGWREIRAVKEGRVALLDGHHYFNRPGPRLVDSLEILVEILQPERGRPQHRGSGWEWLERSAEAIPITARAAVPSQRSGPGVVGKQPSG